MREPNPIDFWRGLALLMIFINHVPGNAFSSFTLRNFAVSDAAELFVFLAGWSLSFATGSPDAPHLPAQVTFRLVWRALQLYRAQIVITFLALAILAGTSLYWSNPIYLEWNDAGLAFYDPVHALPGLALLTYQLGYFNILPLYIVLLLIAPVFIVIARRSAALAVVLSLALYSIALVTRLTLPSWPSQDQWYFNPLSWQLLLVLGFVTADQVRTSEGFRRAAARLVPYAAAVAIAFAVVTWFHLWPDPIHMPEPRLLFLFDKTYLSPARIVSLLAIVLAFQGVYRLIAGPLGPAGRWLCKLGRNSLPVFAVGSLLALIGQLVRFVSDGDFLVDVAIVVFGFGVSGVTAWFVEWRQQPRQSPQD
ncbi:MAG: OpgC domain-containing protein [Pseudomonadota bacterium]